eukprot:GHRQ01017427.1.p2 GENE.GHRQ01017427.1~~GHRQ01017427.1.p2  ORF type:complete len:201 (-),score=40.02 GHRQ01017427.1:641-1243(-)
MLWRLQYGTSWSWEPCKRQLVSIHCLSNLIVIQCQTCLAPELRTFLQTNRLIQHWTACRVPCVRAGHSSWAAAGLGYCTWLLLDRLQVFAAAGAGHSWRLVVACMPALGALAIGISRVTDYWHHPTDVAAGLLLGCGVSWLCYRQQRVRLAAEVDPVSYAGGAAAATGQVGSGGTGHVGGSMRMDEDGLPLLQQQGVSPV